MHALPSDREGNCAGGRVLGDLDVASTAKAANKTLPVLSARVDKRTLHAVAPIEPPGQFRHVDHGW